MDAPVTTTVISLEVPLSGDAPRAEVLVSFDQTLVAAGRQIGTIHKEQGKLQMTITIEPETALGPALAQLSGSMVKFEFLCKTLQVRGVVHHGVVFRNEVAGEVSYIGSALRASQSALRKLEASGGLFATRGFIAHAVALKPPAARFDALTGADAADGVCRISVDAKAAAVTTKPSAQLTSADPEFLAYLKKRLAEHLGPFASAMVEHQRVGTPLPEQLVADMAREIDDPGVRKQFETDLYAYISTAKKA
jgi:hypothetical protein